MNAEDLVLQLLRKRGLADEEARERFLNPDYDSETHDPMLFRHMERAVERILRGLKKKEIIAVFSDYDADGIPGAVIMRDVLTMCGGDPIIYIPHRTHEGFGLSTHAVEKLHDRGVALLITVDCGITDAPAVARANELGMDVIITDHHVPPETIPEAYAILNPAIPEETYPFPHLCGAGVAFKLACALITEKRNQNDGVEIIPEGAEKWLLDMVGIATISDMVPLVGENRVLAKYGLTVLKKARRLGLRTLYEKLRIRAHALTEDDIAFSITPRINAASRMDEPEVAYRLLVTDDPVEAEALVKHLDHINNERKGTVAAYIKEARKRLLGESGAVLVVGDPRWNPGVVGLVAHRLAEEFGKPAFVWGRGTGETIKGSCRSDGVLDVRALMERASDAFLEYGGHEFSGGFSVSAENIHMLADTLGKAYDEAPHIPPTNDVQGEDAPLPLSYATQNTLSILEGLAPFGKENPKPLFSVSAPVVRAERFGADSAHIKVLLQDGATRVQAIKFFAGHDASLTALSEGDIPTLLCNLERDPFSRYYPVRLRIVDMV